MPNLKTFKKALGTLTLLMIFSVFGYLFFSRNTAVAQTNISPDAIAIRVMPNNEHYTAQVWYRNRKFSGSPQTLKVDGYDAVRDGRTVYVNGANVSAGAIFTNIYVISYNQEAERPTVDIFGQILSRWKFNNNLLTQGHCRKNPSTACLMDSECPTGDNCDSMKARVIRDVRRLSDVAVANDYLARYYTRGYYPKLNAGSYLANRTLSVWPSWQENLSAELGVSMVTDPLNSLGDCPNYDPITCWNESAKTFATSWPSLPTNSLVYNYTTNPSGSSANLCAVFESGLAINGTVPCTISGCLDFDLDGFGNPGSTLCTAGSILTDCNDLDAGIHAPTGPENTAALCGNTTDDDCDGLVDCADPDCAPTAPCTAVCGDFVCNGTASCPPCTAAEDPDCAGSCCGDGTCDVAAGECVSGTHPCPVDCFCGNGTVECGEQCEPGPGCTLACTLAVACTDFDGDFYIEENTAVASCPLICGPSHNAVCTGNNDSASNNCSDSDAQRRPGLTEWCDGKDNDCNGVIDDSFNAENCQNVCTSAGFWWTNNGGSLNCCGNDPFEPALAADRQAHENSPLAKCSDGIDNDCDGTCDTLNGDCFAASVGDIDCSGACSNINEADHVGITPGCNQCGNSNDDDNNQTAPTFPFTTTEASWGLFVGEIDHCDPACGPGLSVIDFDNYEPTEATCDGLDNDCDGAIDEGLAAPLNPVQLGVCSGSTQTCSGAGGWIADYSGVLFNEWPAELSCDGRDNNCNGTIDEAITAPCGSNVGVCVAGTDTCVVGGAGVWTGVCIGAIGPSLEICNGLDDDCDTVIDNGVSCGLNSNQTGVCSGSSQICGGAGCMDDYTSIATYEAVETLCDGLDNDCDGAIDETAVCSNPLGTGLGVCSPFTQTCVAGACIDDYTGVPNWQASEAACYDTMDNDCDGLTDNPADPDCIIYCDFDFDLPCALRP